LFFQRRGYKSPIGWSRIAAPLKKQKGGRVVGSRFTCQQATPTGFVTGSVFFVSCFRGGRLKKCISVNFLLAIFWAKTMMSLIPDPKTCQKPTPTGGIQADGLSEPGSTYLHYS
jgi:hypothetical protein